MTNSGTRKTALVLLSSLIFTAGCATAAQTKTQAPAQPAAPPQAPAAAPAPVQRVAFKFRTSYKASMSTAAFIDAQKLYWPGLGLDIDLSTGTGSSEAVQTVAAGAQQAGFASVDAIIAGIQAGAPLKIVAVVQRRDSSGVIFPVDSGIKSLKDLVGKTVTRSPGGHVGNVFDAALKKEGIDPNSIRMVSAQTGSEYTLIKQKKVDAITGYVGAQDVKLGCQGFKATNIPFAKYGLDFYGQALFVNTDWAKKAGDDVVTRLVLGLVQGAVKAKQDPDEVIKLMAEFRPDVPVDRNEEWSSLAWRLPYEESPDAKALKEHGYGWIDAQEMAQTQDALVETGIIDKKADPSQYYTTRYLEDARVQKAAAQWQSLPWPQVPDDVKKACGL